MNFREELNKLLNTEFIGRNIVHEYSTDSTNSLAKRKNTLADGTLFVADIQTAGRGRSGKSWVSDNKDGLWMSILLKPEKKPAEISSLTLVVGLAVARALRKDFNIEAFIKWPNDIVLGSKKLCGILCEASAEGEEIKYAVCGIGINLNQNDFCGELRSVGCSLKSITGKEFSRQEICASVVNNFELLYIEYLKCGIKNMINEYSKYCITIGKSITVIRNGNEFPAYGAGISDEGELIIKTDTGYETVSSGEVSVRGLFGYI